MTYDRYLLTLGVIFGQDSTVQHFYCYCNTFIWPITMLCSISNYFWAVWQILQKWILDFKFTSEPSRVTYKMWRTPANPIDIQFGITFDWASCVPDLFFTYICILRLLEIKSTLFFTVRTTILKKYYRSWNEILLQYLGRYIEKTFLCEKY